MARSFFVPPPLLILLCLLYGAVPVVGVNEFVVSAFRSLNFGNDSDFRHAHQLISALALVLFVSLVLIASVTLFRFYMLYCQSYENTRRFHSPLYRRAGYAAAQQSVTLMPANGASSTGGDSLVLTAPASGIARSTGVTANGTYTFHSIFHESDVDAAHLV